MVEEELYATLGVEKVIWTNGIIGTPGRFF